MYPAEAKALSETLEILDDTFRKIPSEPDGARTAKALFDRLRRDLAVVYIERAVYRVIEDHYDLGRVVSISQLFGGYVNQSFAVVTQNGPTRRTVFVRRYKSGIQDHEVRLEHAYVRHLCAAGIREAADLILTADAGTFVKYPVAHVDAGTQKSVFAVYAYLWGEDRFAWDYPHCNPEELRNAIALMARLHAAAEGFDPGGDRKVEPAIGELVQQFPAIYETFIGQASQSPPAARVAAAVADRAATLRLAAEECRNALTQKDLPVVMIHGDFHPGNLKFSGPRVTGVFDFDWCKLEARLFDVACAMIYFCGCWEGETDGSLRWGQIDRFLAAYQESARRYDAPGPLGDTEIECLPAMLQAANLYILYWALNDCFSAKPIDAGEYLRFVNHSLRLTETLQAHWRDVARLARSHR